MDKTTDLSIKLKEPCDTEIYLKHGQSVEQNSFSSPIRQPSSFNPLQQEGIATDGMSDLCLSNDPESPQTSVSSLMWAHCADRKFLLPRNITNKDVDDSYPSSQKEAVLSDLQPVANERNPGAFNQDTLPALPVGGQVSSTRLAN